jgi:hypothetical protein
VYICFGRVLALFCAKCFFLFGRNKTGASLQACAHFGRIVALPRVKRFFSSVTRDRRIAPGVRLLGPNRGPVPRQAVFLFGRLETDASLQACAYFGRIMALYRVKRFFTSVNSRPTHRSRRALTSAESWPCTASSGFSLRSTRDRRIAPGVRLLRPNHGPVPRQAVFHFGQLETDASLQACAYFGRIMALYRVKRFFSSVNDNK